MFFSIITVCYNCRAEIESTIRSVLSQSISDYEYLIIDGASGDGTAEIAKEYADNHSHVSVVSEPDHGIYDAMNKGVRFAKGDYILFMNAGDTFYSDTVLENAKKIMGQDKADIYYGDVMKEGSVVRQNQKLTLFRLVYMERMLCHQSIFAKSSQLKEHPFDVNLKICADRNWLVERLQEKASMRYMPGLVVCDYDTTGVSSNFSAYQGDSLRIARKHGGNKAVLFVKVKRAIGKMLGHNYF